MPPDRQFLDRGINNYEKGISPLDAEFFVKHAKHLVNHIYPLRGPPSARSYSLGGDIAPWKTPEPKGTWQRNAPCGRVCLKHAEIFAERSADCWSKERAVESAMDKVLQAAVYVSGAERFKTSIDDFLERFKKGHVLLLGGFSEVEYGAENLEQILDESIISAE